MDIGQKKIAVIGLGYVGLPLAVEFAKTRPVLGFDVNKARVAEISGGSDSTREVSKDELKTAKHLKCSSNFSELAKCGIFIVTVPTPIDQANRPDLTPLVKASETVGKAISKGDIVIYESTVFPGCTRDVCVPILEKQSGLKFNKDFFAGYSPERINPGDKEHTVEKILKVNNEAIIYDSKKYVNFSSYLSKGMTLN